MIYLSDMKINLTLVIDNEVIIQDDNAGLHKKIKNDHSSDNGDFTIGLIPEFNIKDDTYLDYEFTGIRAYRINGLTQFVDVGNNHKSNVIIDIFSDLNPLDNDYPLSMSRETIDSDMQYKINPILRKYNENPISTDSNTKRQKSPKIRANKGALIQGMVTNPNVEYSHTYGNLGDKISQFDASNKITGITKTENFPAIGKLHYVIEDRDKEEYITTDEKRILRLWGFILSIVTDQSELFGIGITGDSYSEAMRSQSGDSIYYFLNTDYFITQVIGEFKLYTMDEIIHSLHMLAVHESVHCFQSSHNESFTMTEQKLYRLSLANFLENMPKMRAMIRNLELLKIQELINQ